MIRTIGGFFPGELKPSATVGGCIEIYERAWPNPDQTVAQIERESTLGNGVYWERAPTIGQGVNQQMRTNYMMAVTHLASTANNGLLQNVHNQFRMLLLATTPGYSSRNGYDGELWHEGYNMLKYSTGEEYKAHYDGSSETARIISAISYFNSDYEGGELEFPNFNIKIKPEPGMLILFPSNFAYQHIAHPITKGTKYALVTWIKDRDA